MGSSTQYTLERICFCRPQFDKDQKSWSIFSMVANIKLLLSIVNFEQTKASEVQVGSSKGDNCTNLIKIQWCLKNQHDKCLHLLISFLIVIQTNHNFETFHHKKICKNYLKWVNGNKNLVCMAVRSSRNTRKILVQTKSSFLWTHLCTFKRSWEATSTSKGKGPTFEERHEWRGRKVRQFSK